MSRTIAEAFQRAADSGRAAFMPFLTGGFPDRRTCLELLVGLERQGADLIELGIPFSDPLADGPVIQHASQLALEAGATPPAVLELAAEATARLQAPLVIMTYYNPVLRMGLAEFARRAARAGVAGVIIPDLPPEEASEWLEAARGQGLDTVFMAAPTTPPDRLEHVAELSRGFLYYVSLTGVTGSELALDQRVQKGLAQARQASPVPVAVGFGVATPRQARALAELADGVIVGSALMRLLLEAPEPEQRAETMLALAGELAAALGK